MSDFLLDLSQNPTARKLIKSLGLPLPMPTPLERASGPMHERPLADKTVVFASASAGAVASVCARTLTVAGASPVLVGGEALAERFRDHGEAYGRRARILDLADADARADLRPAALIMDVTEIETPRQLRRLYVFFSPLIRALARSGRLIVIGRPADAADDAAEAAARAGLSGFVRSAAKEIGKRGATAQLVLVDEGAEDHLEGVLRFLASPRSAFVSGQVLRVSNRAGAAEPLRPLRPLDGKIALVTGAARGIGEATARLLAAEGAKVICLDRPEDDGPIAQLARELGGEPLPCDVSSPEAPSHISAALRAHGGVDIVVHNAGVTRDKTLAKMSPELWDQVVDINLVAVVSITSALIGEDVINRGGRVICLSSVAGIAGNMGQTNYAASKSGIIGYVEKLSLELAADGIAAFAVAPGFIETRLTAAIPTMIREVGRRLSALGQGGQPVDVGQLITFLSTPGSTGLSGQTVRVCGGAFIGA